MFTIKYTPSYFKIKFYLFRGGKGAVNVYIIYANVFLRILLYVGQISNYTLGPRLIDKMTDYPAVPINKICLLICGGKVIGLGET